MQFESNFSIAYFITNQQNSGWNSHCWHVAGAVGIPLLFINLSCAVILLKKFGFAG